MIIKVNLTLKDVFSPVANSVAIYFRLTVITLKSSGSVANIYKGQAALICGRNYPANAINCL